MYVSLFSLFHYDFSAEVKGKLTEAHKDAVQECIANAEQLTELHTQIVACDQVFEVKHYLI